MKKAIFAFAAVVFLCIFTSKITYAQQITKERILHFPKDYSLGKIFIQDEMVQREIDSFTYWTAERDWQFLGQARGDVNIPAWNRAKLFVDVSIYKEPNRLSALKLLAPVDLYSLAFVEGMNPGEKATNQCMPYISHLTGLKQLDLGNASVSAAGLKHISQILSLEILDAPKFVDREGMKEIVKLVNLKGLFFQGSLITNENLKFLSELKNLEELGLQGTQVNNEGLRHLAACKGLSYLCLTGDFTEKGISYLKDVNSLKTLYVFSDPKFTNECLKPVSQMPQLERFSIHWVDTVTDDGIQYLASMPNLRKLDLYNAKLTDKACEYISQIKTLDYLNLPNHQITDEGISRICELENLKFLWAGGSSSSPLTDKSLVSVSKLKNLEELCIAGNGFTDEGVKNIAGLKNLKRLWLFNAPQVTDASLKVIGQLKKLQTLALPSKSQITVSGLKNLNYLSDLKSLNIYTARQDKSVMDISGLVDLTNLSITLNHTSTEKDSFQDEDMACLGKLKKLDTLQICSPGIGDMGLGCLSDLDNLIFLNVAESEITDAGLIYLGGMKKLQRIIINGSHITDSGIWYLQDLKSLESIEITSDKIISQKAILGLKKNLPYLERCEIKTAKPQQKRTQ